MWSGCVLLLLTLDLVHVTEGAVVEETDEAVEVEESEEEQFSGVVGSVFGEKNYEYGLREDAADDAFILF